MSGSGAARTRSARKPVPKWSFDEGVLTVCLDSDPIVLGYFATHQEAAIAAAAYFAKQTGLLDDEQI
jgi:hypothetical protein